MTTSPTRTPVRIKLRIGGDVEPRGLIFDTGYAVVFHRNFEPHLAIRVHGDAMSVDDVLLDTVFPEYGVQEVHYLRPDGLHTTTPDELRAHGIRWSKNGRPQHLLPLLDWTVMDLDYRVPLHAETKHERVYDADPDLLEQRSLL